MPKLKHIVVDVHDGHVRYGLNALERWLQPEPWMYKKVQSLEIKKWTFPSSTPPEKYKIDLDDILTSMPYLQTLVLGSCDVASYYISGPEYLFDLHGLRYLRYEFDGILTNREGGCAFAEHTGKTLLQLHNHHAPLDEVIVVTDHRHNFDAFKQAKRKFNMSWFTSKSVFEEWDV